MGNEQLMKEAVATVGPVSVAIDARSMNIALFYDGKFSSLHLGCPI